MQNHVDLRVPGSFIVCVSEKNFATLGVSAGGALHEYEIESSFFGLSVPWLYFVFIYS